MMDYANEPYVRIYTRDDMGWKLLDWEAQCVELQLKRKVDRAGVLPLEDALPTEAVALQTGLPLEMVERGLATLIKRKRVHHRGDVLTIPNWIESQETSKSDKQRQKDSRDRRRALADALPENVTTRDDRQSQNVTAPSRNVTDCHAVTDAVTDVTLTSAVLASASLAIAPQRVASQAAPNDRFASSFGADEVVWEAMKAAYEKVRGAKLTTSTKRGPQFRNHAAALFEAASENTAASDGVPESTVESVLRVTFRAFYAANATDEWMVQRAFPLSKLSESFAEYFRKGRFEWETDPDWSLKQAKPEQPTGSSSFSTAQSSLASGGRR